MVARSQGKAADCKNTIPGTVVIYRRSVKGCLSGSPPAGFSWTSKVAPAVSMCGAMTASVVRTSLCDGLRTTASRDLTKRSGDIAEISISGARRRFGLRKLVPGSRRRGQRIRQRLTQSDAAYLGPRRTEVCEERVGSKRVQLAKKQ
jgi:hypothetical protein